MDSTVILGLMLMTVSFIVVGHVTLYKIFNLFAIGLILTLMLELNAETGFIVSGSGLIMYLGYYTFLGGK